MKTLDEVIKAIEWCTDIDQSGCSECPYSGKDDEGCYRDDALHYLWEYRTEQKILSDRKEHYEYWEHKYYAELEKNDPLSWDELKQMKGKPVWVEGRTMDEKDGNYKYWCIVGQVDKMDTYIHLREHGYHYWKSTYGDWWQAYRKERS